MDPEVSPEVADIIKSAERMCREIDVGGTHVLISQLWESGTVVLISTWDRRC